MSDSERDHATIPTQEQITAEIAKLRELREKIPSRTMFGDSNTNAVDAQIAVLEKRMTHDQVCNQYDSEDNDDTSGYVLDAALEAFYWLIGDTQSSISNGRAPSINWQILADNPNRS